MTWPRLCQTARLSVGLGLLFMIAIYQLISFLVSLILSSILAVFLAYMFEFCWGYGLPLFIVCFIQACLLIALARIHTNLHDGTIGRRLAPKIREFPILLNMSPVIITICLSLGAFYEIYFQYWTLHLEKSEAGGSQRRPATEKGPLRFHKSRTHGTETGPYIDPTLFLIMAKDSITSFYIFMVSFSYLVYTGTKIIQQDGSQPQQPWERPPNDLGKYSNVVILFGVFFQGALLFVYGIPVVYVTLFSKVLNAAHGSVFSYIAVFSGFLGIGASYVETKEPFPQVRNLPPSYYYECQAKARLLLLNYGILPFTYFWFLNFDSFVQIPLHTTEEDHRFFLFTISFALLVFQTIKIISFQVLVTRHPLVIFRARRRRRRRRLPALDPEAPPRNMNLVENPPEELVPVPVELCSNPDLTSLEQVLVDSSRPTLLGHASLQNNNIQAEHSSQANLQGPSQPEDGGLKRIKKKRSRSRKPAHPETFRIINEVIDNWLLEIDKLVDPMGESEEGTLNVESSTSVPVSSRDECQEPGPSTSVPPSQPIPEPQPPGVHHGPWRIGEGPYTDFDFDPTAQDSNNNDAE